MKRILGFLILLLVVSCGSEGLGDGNIIVVPNEESDNPGNTGNPQFLIIGSWLETSSGVVLEDGSKEVEEGSCSNDHVFRFFESGLFELDVHSVENDQCVFDFTQNGTYEPANSTDFPDSNFKFTLNSMAENDEEVNYPIVSFRDNSTMQIEYQFEDDMLGLASRYIIYTRTE